MPPCVLVPPLLSPLARNDATVRPCPSVAESLSAASWINNRPQKKVRQLGWQTSGAATNFPRLAIPKRTKINARKKELSAVIHLDSCRTLTSAELDTPKFLHQLRVWQKRNKSQQLDGEYVSWGLGLLHKLRQPTQLEKAQWTPNPTNRPPHE